MTRPRSLKKLVIWNSLVSGVVAKISDKRKGERDRQSWANLIPVPHPPPQSNASASEGPPRGRQGPVQPARMFPRAAPGRGPKAESPEEERVQSRETESKTKIQRPYSRPPPLRLQNQIARVGPVERWWQAPSLPRRACLVSWPCSGRGRLTPPQTTGLHVTRTLAGLWVPAQPRLHSCSSSLWERGANRHSGSQTTITGGVFGGQGVQVWFYWGFRGQGHLCACARAPYCFPPQTHRRRFWAAATIKKWLERGR